MASGVYIRRKIITNNKPMKENRYVIIRKDTGERITKKFTYAECLNLWNKIDSDHKIFEIVGV